MLVKICVMSAAATALTATGASAVTFDATALETVPTTIVDGLALTTSTSDGEFSSGTLEFPGLLVGRNDESGTYEFSFSSEITSISLSFFGLTNVEGSPPRERITGFATEDGAVSIDYTDVANTVFAGNVIEPIDVPAGTFFVEGDGIISYSGGPFSSFFISHSQNSINGGIRIGSIEVTLSEVPLPAGGLMLGSALLLMGWRRSGLRR